MSSINLFVGVGRIVRDVETKQIRPGLTAGKFTLAMEHIIRGKEGEKKEVCFIDCTVWNQQAIDAEQLKKGSEVFVKGRLRLEQWEDKKTQEKKSKHTVAVDTLIHNFALDTQIDLANAFEPVAKQQQAKPAAKPVQQPQFEEGSFNDELPF